MNQESISILFYLNKSKINKKGLCPVKCRITYKKKRKEFSTGEFMNPSEWNSKHQKAISTTINNQQINLQLEIITANIKKAYLQLQLAGTEFSVEDIFNTYSGKSTAKEVKVIEYFRNYLSKINRLIGKDLELATWKKIQLFL